MSFPLYQASRLAALYSSLLCLCQSLRSHRKRDRARTKRWRGREQVEGRCAEWRITVAKRGEFHGRWSVVSSET